LRYNFVTDSFYIMKFHTKWHLDLSSCLARTHQCYRQDIQTDTQTDGWIGYSELFYKRSPKTLHLCACVHCTVNFWATVCKTARHMISDQIPQIDIIGAMVIVWRVRGKIIRSVLCNMVRNNCAQCNVHTYKRT